MRTLGVLILMAAVFAGGWWIAMQPSGEGGVGLGREPGGAIVPPPPPPPPGKSADAPVGSAIDAPVGAALDAPVAASGDDEGSGSGGGTTTPFSNRYVGNPADLSMDDAALFADDGVEGKASRPDYDWVSFKALTGFEYRLPDPYELRDSEKTLEELLVDWDQIPGEVKALDGGKIEMLGFMSPIEVDNEGVKSFSLLANQLFCCFGIPPRNNEWVMIEMPDGERAEYYPYEPVSVFGTLVVGEEFENGYLTSLYRMTADIVEGGY